MARPESSAAPAGCPAAQLSSVTVHQRWHRTPQARGWVLQLLPSPTPGASRMSRLSPVPPTGYKVRVPVTSSLGSTNLLQHLTEFRETDYPLDPWFIVKVGTRERPDGRDAQGRGWGKGAAYPCFLGTPLSPISTRPPTQKLSEPHPCGF